MSSRFADKLGSNYCPTDNEALEIKDLISETKPQLTLLDTQIAALENSLAVLRAERQRVSGFIDAHQALLSPIRRLPDDLIREICVACCIPTERNCVLSSSEAPILLGRVCSSWRAISLATPQLWARLYLPEPIFQGVLRVSDKRRFEQRIAAARQWLARSGQCPLAITLVGCNQRTLAAREFTSTRFIELVMEFAARWQDIRLIIDTASLRKLATLQAVDVPVLRSLYMSYYREDFNEETQSLGRATTPQCSSFIAFSGNGVMNLPVLPIRWQQLTHLALEIVLFMADRDGRVNSAGLLDVLRRCPRLEFAKLILDDEETPASIQELPPDYVEMNVLHTLELACVSAAPWAFTQALARLSTPRLRNFAIAGHFRYTIPSFDCTPYIANFFSLTSQLENFQILLDDSITSSDLQAMLTHMPTTVRKLLICDTDNVAFSLDFAVGLPVPTSALVDDVFTSFMGGSTPRPSLEQIVVHRCVRLSDASIRRCCDDPSIAERFPALRLVLVRDQGANDLSRRSQPVFSPWHGLPAEEDGVDPAASTAFGWMEDWKF
ncbi:hypothetical protein HMN09_00723500 [Mycena chlorophos]|uniref:F-box domain-containing protein n=1 Tax=Mycena chlorophos TaxID=658473 RepID=A0A8H6W8M2_MYCCL|nr:hypothetical protein HMN09_00723500 [Mycena chlorophos]